MPKDTSLPRGVSVALLNADGLVAISKRLDSTGRMQFPGGHVEKGETYLEAAVREVREETGADLDPMRFDLLFENVESIGYKKESYLAAAFVVKLKPGEGNLGNPEPHKHTNWAFVSPESIDPETMLRSAARTLSAMRAHSDLRLAGPNFIPDEKMYRLGKLAYETWREARVSQGLGGRGELLDWNKYPPEAKGAWCLVALAIREEVVMNAPPLVAESDESAYFRVTPREYLRRCEERNHGPFVPP